MGAVGQAVRVVLYGCPVLAGCIRIIALLPCIVCRADCMRIWWAAAAIAIHDRYIIVWMQSPGLQSPNQKLSRP